MTTKAMVGIWDNPEHTKWHAVPVAADGYPDGVGQAIWINYTLVFNKNINELVKWMITDHPEGYGKLAHTNLLYPSLDAFGEWTIPHELRRMISDRANQIQTNHADMAGHLRQIETFVSLAPSYLDRRKTEGYTFITQDSTDEDSRYWSEWTYLIDVYNSTVTVFWGSPASERSEVVDLTKKISAEDWDKVQSKLWGEEDDDA